MKLTKDQHKRAVSTIKAIMIKNNIRTEKEFCAQNNLSQSTVQEIKSGRAGLSKNMEKVIMKYGASLNYIYQNQGPQFIKPLSEMTIDEKLNLIIDLLQQK